METQNCLKKVILTVPNAREVDRTLLSWLNIGLVFLQMDRHFKPD